MINDSDDLASHQWLEALVARYKLREHAFEQLTHRWWEAWRLGEREALIQGLEGVLGRDAATREVNALKHVLVWDTPLRPQLVWTGFEPFDVHASNPSGAVAALAAERAQSSR